LCRSTGATQTDTLCTGDMQLTLHSTGECDLSNSQQLLRRSDVASLVAATLKSEIVPKLLARRSVLVSDINTDYTVTNPTSQGRDMPPLRHSSPSLEDVEAFANFALNGEESDCIAVCEAWLDAGLSVSSLFLQLMAPAAVSMGDKWCSDTANFGEVTLGMAFLHGLMRRYTSQLTREVDAAPHEKSILIAPMPRGNHFFGVMMVEEFFRAHRWDVHSSVNESDRNILEGLRNEFFDVVGVSMGIFDQSDACKRLIANIRKNSKNESIAIVVGGPPFVLKPELAKEIGADAVACDALDAVAVAHTLTEVPNAI